MDTAASDRDATGTDWQRFERCRAAGNALAAAVQRHADMPSRATKEALYDAWLDWLQQDARTFNPAVPAPPNQRESSSCC